MPLESPDLTPIVVLPLTRGISLRKTSTSLKLCHICPATSVQRGMIIAPRVQAWGEAGVRQGTGSSGTVLGWARTPHFLMKQLLEVDKTQMP